MSVPAPGPEESIDQQARTWALFTHLSSLSMYVGVPFGNVVGPLVLWLIRKDDMPFVDDQGKEALNFNISVLLYAVIAGIFALVTIGVGLIIAIPLWLILVVGHLVYTILGTINANNGVYHRYPLTIRFIK